MPVIRNDSPKIKALCNRQGMAYKDTGPIAPGKTCKVTDEELAMLRANPVVNDYFRLGIFSVDPPKVTAGAPVVEAKPEVKSPIKLEPAKFAKAGKAKGKTKVDPKVDPESEVF